MSWQGQVYTPRGIGVRRSTIGVIIYRSVVDGLRTSPSPLLWPRSVGHKRGTKLIRHATVLVVSGSDTSSEDVYSWGCQTHDPYQGRQSPMPKNPPLERVPLLRLPSTYLTLGRQLREGRADRALALPFRLGEIRAQKADPMTPTYFLGCEGRSSSGTIWILILPSRRSILSPTRWAIYAFSLRLPQ